MATPDLLPPTPDLGIQPIIDAGVACVPLPCVTRMGEVASSPCAPRPQLDCVGATAHEVCQCGMREAGVYFQGFPGSGQPLENIAYVYQPAEGDGPNVRLALDGQVNCVAPVHACNGREVCTGHRMVAWHLPEPVWGRHRIQIFHDVSCRNLAQVVADLQLEW